MIKFRLTLTKEQAVLLRQLLNTDLNKLKFNATSVFSYFIANPDIQKEILLKLNKAISKEKYKINLKLEHCYLLLNLIAYNIDDYTIDGERVVPEGSDALLAIPLHKALREVIPC